MLAKKEIKAWLQASRLASQLYLLLPLVLGQFLACSYGQAVFSFTLFSLSLVYSLSLQLFIVYANDLADYETDKLNENSTIFSGGSRVLVDKLLKPRDLEFSACLSLAMVFACSLFFSYHQGSLVLLLLALSGPVLLWMYSYEPFKLSYRGGGELLQALGLALVLPFLGFFIQGGQQSLSLFPLFFALFFTQVACAMSTTIPDVTSDSFSHKITFTLFLGPYKSCSLIFLLHTISYGIIFYFLQQGYYFQAKSVLAIFCFQLPLTFLLLYSFYRRRVSLFVFFSLSLTLSLFLFLIYLSVNEVFLLSS